MLTTFINIYLKLFVIVTPFFVVSAFISLTKGMSQELRRRTAIKATLAILVSAYVLYFFGEYIFDLFGITIDAFRVGAGLLLFLSAVSLVKGPGGIQAGDAGEDIAVVPLAIPITVGPGTIGALMVMGTQLQTMADKVIASLALFCAVMSVGALLLMAGGVERLVGRQGLVILTKLTGLFVSAIAAQIVLTGVRNFLAL